uniref:Claudin n=1 Tax=Oryzias sinensis TaxID=183150 RepID=A0A8C7WYL3_9TELE
MSIGLELIGISLCILGWIIAIAACALPMWRVTAFIGNNIVTAQIIWEGMWMTCVVQSTGQMQCKVYDSMLALSQDLQAARALTVISILLAILAVLVAIAGAKCTNCIEDEASKAKRLLQPSDPRRPAQGAGGRPLHRLGSGCAPGPGRRTSLLLLSAAGVQVQPVPDGLLHPEVCGGPGPGEEGLRVNEEGQRSKDRICSPHGLTVRGTKVSVCQIGTFLYQIAPRCLRLIFVSVEKTSSIICCSQQTVKVYLMQPSGHWSLLRYCSRVIPPVFMFCFVYNKTFL